MFLKYYTEYCCIDNRLGRARINVERAMKKAIEVVHGRNDGHLV
jgi:hypothetical protein